MPPKARGPGSPAPKAKAGSPLGSPASKSAPARPKLGGLSPPAAKSRPSSVGRASISGPFSAGKAPAKAKGKAKGKAKAKAVPEDAAASTQRLHDVPVRASTTVWETDTEDPASTMELPQVSDVDGLGSPDLRGAESGPESPHFMASGAASEMSAAFQSSADGGSPGESPVLQEPPAQPPATAAPAAVAAAKSTAAAGAGTNGSSGRRASQSFFSDESGDETSAAGSPVTKKVSSKPKAALASLDTGSPAVQEVAKSDASSPKSDSAPVRETAVPNPTARVIKAAKAALLVQKIAGGFEKLGLGPSKASSDSSDTDERDAKKKKKKHRAKFGKQDSDENDESSDSLAEKEKEKAREKEREKEKELEKQKARKDRDGRRASAASFWSDDSDEGSHNRSQSRSSRALSPPNSGGGSGEKKRRSLSPRGSITKSKDPPPPAAPEEKEKEKEEPPKLELEAMQATPGGESSLMSTSATLTGNGNGGPPTFGMPTTTAASAVPAIITTTPAGETASSNGGMASLASLQPAGGDTSRGSASPSPALSPRDKEESLEAAPVLSSIAKVVSEERHALSPGMQPTPSKGAIPEEESPLLMAALQSSVPSEKSTSNAKESKEAPVMKEEGCETEISALQVEELLRAVPLLQELEGQQLLIQQGLTEALEYERRARAEEIARCEKLSEELGQALQEEKKRYEEQAREREMELEEHFRHYEQQWRDQVRCLTEEVEQLRKEAQKAAAAREAAAQRDAEAAAAVEAAKEAAAEEAAAKQAAAAEAAAAEAAAALEAAATATKMPASSCSSSSAALPRELPLGLSPPLEKDSDIAAVYLRRRFYGVHSTRRADALTKAVRSNQISAAEAVRLLNGSSTDDLERLLENRRQQREQPGGSTSSSSSSSKVAATAAPKSNLTLATSGLRAAPASVEESSPVGSTKSGRGVQFTDGAEITKFRSDKPIAVRAEPKERPSALDQVETKRYLASRITSIADAVFNRKAKVPPASVTTAGAAGAAPPRSAAGSAGELELLSAPVQTKEVRRSQLVPQASPSMQQPAQTKVVSSVRAIDTSMLDGDAFWKPYRNMDKVNHGMVHSDVEAMDCRNEVELQAVKSRVESMGYSGFTLVRNMACLKKVPGQLNPQDLEATSHNCTFWLYSPPSKGRWIELENMDKVEFSSCRSDVESMSCRNAEECAEAKRRVETMGYSGFVVVGGTAYLKSAGKLRPSDLQAVQHRCVFYIYEPSEAAATNGGGRRRGETAEEARSRLRCGAPAEEEPMTRRRSSIEDALIDKPSTGSNSPRSQVLKAEAQLPEQDEEEPFVQRTRSGRCVSVLAEGEAPMEAQRSLIEDAVIDKPSTGNSSPRSPAQARRSIEEAMVDSRSTGSRSGKRVSLFVDGEVSPKVQHVDVPSADEALAICSQRSVPKVAIALASPSTGESAVVKPGEEELGFFDEPAGTLTQSQRQAVKRRSRLEAEDRLRKIFKHCDKNQDGTINKRELIKIIRRRADIAEFFGLPSSVHQEDGSRDAVEVFFQSLDRDANREITWEEFFAWYLQSGCSKPVPDSHRSKKEKSPAVRKGAEALINGLKSGEVVELLAQFEAGKIPPPPAAGDKAHSSAAWRKGTLYLKAGLLSGEVEKLLADYEAAEAKACKDKKNYDRSETWRKGAAILKEGLLSGEVDKLIKDFETQEKKSEKKAKKESKKSEQSPTWRKGAGVLKKGLMSGEVEELLKEYEEAEAAAATSKSKSERSVAFKKGAEVLKAGLLSGEVDKLIQEFEAAEEKAKKKGEQTDTWRKGAQFLKAGLLTGEVDRLLQEFEAAQTQTASPASKDDKRVDDQTRTPSQPSKPGPSVPMIPIADLVPLQAPYEESPQARRAPREGPSSEDLKAQYNSLKKAIASAFRRAKRETDAKRLRLDALKDLIDKGEPPISRPSQSAHILLRKEDEEWRKASRLAKTQNLSREDLMTKYIGLADELLKEAQAAAAASSASPRSASASASASAASPRSVSPRSPREPPVTIPAPREVTLGKFFGMADLNRDGSITIREMIKVVRQNPEVAKFFGLPQSVNDRDGSLDRVTSLFQSLDKDGNRSITWEEFRRWYASRPAVPLEVDGDCQLTALPDVAPLPAEEMLGKIFGLCDGQGRGFIRKPVLVEVTRTNSRVASFFGLPPSKGSPSLEQLDALFRELGPSGRDIGWSEFSGWFRQRQQQQLPSMRPILPSPTALEVTAPLQLSNGNDDNSSVGTSPPADLLESFNAAAASSSPTSRMGAVKSATYIPLPVPTNFSFASPGRRAVPSASPSPSRSPPPPQSPVGVVFVAPKPATMSPSNTSTSPTRLPGPSGMPGTIVSPRAWTASPARSPHQGPSTTQTVTVTAVPRQQASTIGSDLFGKLDTNKDGLLTKEELEQAFAVMDVGRKGKVSKEEFKHFMSEGKKPAGAPAQLQFRPAPTPAPSPATAPADVAFPRSPMSSSSGNFVLPMPRRVVVPATHQEAPSPVGFLRQPSVAGFGGMNRASSVGTLGQRTATSPLVTPMAYRFSPTFPGRA